MGEVRIRWLTPVQEPEAVERALQILRRGLERSLLERAREVRKPECNG